MGKAKGLHQEDQDFDGVIVIFSGAELRMNYPEVLNEVGSPGTELEFAL